AVAGVGGGGRQGGCGARRARRGTADRANGPGGAARLGRDAGMTAETVEIAGHHVPMTGTGRRIVLVDNYDSFTYNLSQSRLMLGAEVEVVRNDEVTVEAIAAHDPDGIVLSPGPSRPENAGITPDVIRALGPTTPMLGVCLGHQAMGMVYGGDVIRA